MNVLELPIEAITPSDWNPNQMDDLMAEKLRGSIHRLGSAVGSKGVGSWPVPNHRGCPTAWDRRGNRLLKCSLRRGGRERHGGPVARPMSQPDSR